MAKSCSIQAFLCLVAVCLAISVAIAAASPKIRVKVHSDPRIPITSFSCDGKAPGYYADTATGCQVYHMCDDGSRQYSYICPNTTLFHQRMLICAHWYQVNCSHSEHDFDANLLIGQQDKPFVGEDFWKHRFGGAGNTNFPPQEIPIRSVPSNTIHEPLLNIDKSSPETPAKTTPSRFNKVFPTPQSIELRPPTPQFAQQFQTPQLLKQPQPFLAFTPTQETPAPMRSPFPTQELPVAILPPQHDFRHIFERKPAVELESPSVSDQQNTISSSNIARPSILLEAPLFDTVPQHNVQQHTVTQNKPSIELEPPIQDDAIRTVEKNVLPGFPPSKREDSNRPTQIQQSGAVSQETNSNADAGSIQSNTTLDDRFTQVYILPTGKEPLKGPYQHPDLTQNKVIFTDWNSLLKEKPDDTPTINNFNEYVSGRVPGDEGKEEDVDKSSDDLQRDFSSNVPRPFSFLSVKLQTGNSENLESTHESEENSNSPSTDQKFGQNHPAFDLLPPFDENDQPALNSQPSSLLLGPTSPEMTQASFGNVPPLTSEFSPRPSLNINNVQIVGQQSNVDDDDNNTTVIQNPFQHPFYKIRKMNDNQNIIFIPLTDSDFALELRKVPLNRTRVSRRMVVRNKPLNPESQKSEESRNVRDIDSTSEPIREEQNESAKCGHCHQGYLVDRQGCVPCVPLS